jgi:hypothetical protein
MIDEETRCAQSNAHSEGANPASLDYVQRNCNTRFATWGYVSRETGEIAPFRCKAWGCSVCGPGKAKRLRHQIGVWAEEKRLTRLMTLTLDPQKVCGDPYTHLSDVWRKFRVYLGREYGSRVSFIWIMELQQNGNPHLHVLVDRFVHQKWASRTWEAVGGGRIVDVRYVDIQRVRAYLSKYLTKPWHQMRVPPRKRRCSASQDICLSRTPDEGADVATQSEWVLFAGRGFVMSRADYDALREEYERRCAKARAPT